MTTDRPSFRMASVTYENRSRFEWGCKHYFPGWRVEHQPESARALDWIRFLMLTSADNSTTVIAVRGTLASWNVKRMF